MPSSPKDQQVTVEAHMVCDEGGTHKFSFGKEVTCCDRILCICCFPCYAICSCSLSEGAAFANPLFEQMCCKRSRPDEDEKGRATCTKCGLTEREAIDLSDARTIEASSGNRKTGYFSNAMLMPSAQTTNQQGALSPKPPNSPLSPSSAQNNF
ncbi:hypothetical protein PPACK8108_LOCUS17969 [Phakopsora pachyrhizi]|uniref:Uncharacterized protein n=1 Tax=Phakopsora pachyrhizi TaxID=170000 RepID=A0AAV0BCF2_PHAPC|nr:hypothetical protein PPACK8108_LOCUS17969 [Phakopsora pachyrhizi]